MGTVLISGHCLGPERGRTFALQVAIECIQFHMSNTATGLKTVFPAGWKHPPEFSSAGNGLAQTRVSLQLWCHQTVPMKPPTRFFFSRQRNSADSDIYLDLVAVMSSKITTSSDGTELRESRQLWSTAPVSFTVCCTCNQIYHLSPVTSNTFGWYFFKHYTAGTYSE